MVALALGLILEAYVARFDLPVRTSTRVNRLSRAGDGYRIETDRGAIEAAQVVVAMASYPTFDNLRYSVGFGFRCPRWGRCCPKP